MQHHANSEFFHHSPQVIVREFFHEPEPTSTPKIDIDTVKKSQKKPLPFQAEARSTVWLTGVYRAATRLHGFLDNAPVEWLQWAGVEFDHALKGLNLSAAQLNGALQHHPVHPFRARRRCQGALEVVVTTL